MKETTDEQRCGKCIGVGKVMVMTLHGKMNVTCSVCNGEKVITKDLLWRKTAGRNFNNLRRICKVGLRTISEATGYSMSELSNYEQGRKSERYIDLLKVEDRLSRYLNCSREQHYVYALTGSHSFLPNRELIETFDDYPSAVRFREAIRHSLHKGVSAVYEIQTVRIFEMPLDLSDVSDTKGENNATK